MPCNGYVPCQPEQLRPDLLAERMEGAMPCHNYKGGATVLTVTICGYNVFRARRDPAGLLVMSYPVSWFGQSGDICSIYPDSGVFTQTRLLLCSSLCSMLSSYRVAGLS